MKKAITLLLFLLIRYNSLYGQQPPLITDRPDQTESPFTVPVKNFQGEFGFVFSHDKAKGVHNDVITYLNSLLKFGVSKNLEFRLILENVSYKYYEESVNKHITGINPIQLGFKLNLSSERGLIPTTAFMFHIAPHSWASAGLKNNYMAPKFRFTMQHTITPKINISYNIGAEWNGKDVNPIYIYTLTVGHAITSKISYYLENYGFIFLGEQSDHRFNAGISYLISPNLLLDASTGIGITEVSPNMFVGCGVSWRLSR